MSNEREQRPRIAPTDEMRAAAAPITSEEFMQLTALMDERQRRMFQRRLRSAIDSLPADERVGAAVDAARERVLLQMYAEQPLPASPGRNDSCPCGSGSKFKRCCGQ